ncbi:MAG: hypothetical protein JNK15_15300, partial [Planctomycetes bacterium]|nr:hypothetical protein [Planctomycetota bacterium]
MRRPLARTLLVVGLAACAGAPPVPAAPDLPLSVHYAPAPAGEPAGDPFWFGVEVKAVQAPVAGPAVDLAAAVLPAATGAPFRGASGLPPGCRWLTGA